MPGLCFWEVLHLLVTSDTLIYAPPEQKNGIFPYYVPFKMGRSIVEGSGKLFCGPTSQNFKFSLEIIDATSSGPEEREHATLYRR